MFSIKTGSLELILEVIPVEYLFQHEETLPDSIDNLILEFKNWTHLQNPVIVDENNIVLDGNHRTVVFKKLNFKYILVCRIDYFHEAADLRYWFRLLGKIKNSELLKRIVKEMGGTLREATNKAALEKILESHRLCCGLQQGDFYASISFNEDIVDDAISAYDAVGKIQNRLIEEGIELNYIPCQYVHDSKFCSQLRDDEVVIWTPQITKEMVVDAAKKETLFAPKTTRHIIPARPLNINVPTYWFNENISLEEINRRFSKFIEGKNLRRFGPGQVIDGRYYEEELFVFFDK